MIIIIILKADIKDRTIQIALLYKMPFRPYGPIFITILDIEFDESGWPAAMSTAVRSNAELGMYCRINQYFSTRCIGNLIVGVFYALSSTIKKNY